MTTEAIEGEIIDTENRALILSETVALPVPVDEVLRQWEQYQELTRKLLDDSDYQQIGNKKFKKKSAWRKYARAFNITDRVTHEEIMRDDTGFPIFARLRVEARAMNGRTAEADQECHVRERCCEQPCRKRTWSSHVCCSGDCDGKKHWSHPGDLPATALTRAKNRAISDLIGAGEVSAEEMRDTGDEAPEQPHRPAPTRQRAPAAQRAVAKERSDPAKADHTAFWTRIRLAQIAQGDVHKAAAAKGTSVPMMNQGELDQLLKELEASVGIAQ